MLYPNYFWKKVSFPFIIHAATKALSHQGFCKKSGYSDSCTVEPQTLSF